MVKVSKTVRSRVNKLFLAWVRQYCGECSREMPFTNVCNEETFLEEQIEFVGKYLGFIMIDGPASLNTVERVRRFLSLQTPAPEDHMMEIHFVGGAPIEAIVCVESLNDVDVADVHGLIDFDMMFVYKAGRKRWSNKSAEAFIKELKDDLECDGSRADLKYSFNGSQLVIECTIEE